MEIVEQVEHEYKPGFSLIKYGTILTFNCNLEFARRFNNILTDLAEKGYSEDFDIKVLSQQLKYLMETKEPHEGVIDNDSFTAMKMGHVFVVSLRKDLCMSLNASLCDFLVTNRVSPALFSFAKQLKGYLFPQQSGFVDD